MCHQNVQKAKLAEQKKLEYRMAWIKYYNHIKEIHKTTKQNVDDTNEDLSKISKTL